MNHGVFPEKRCKSTSENGLPAEITLAPGFPLGKVFLRRFLEVLWVFFRKKNFSTAFFKKGKRKERIMEQLALNGFIFHELCKNSAENAISPQRDTSYI